MSDDLAIPQNAQTNAIIEVIERAARDKSIDIEKMERLLQMQERIMARDAEANFNTAMVRAQTQIRHVLTESRNDHTKSNYAKLDAIDKVARNVYTTEGFSLSFDSADCPLDGHIRVICYVAHIAGHKERRQIDIPRDDKGAKGGDTKTATHGQASAFTYGKRLLTMGIFNIVTTNDKSDDDGNAAGGVAKITDSQTKTMTDKIAEMVRLGGSESQFYKWAGFTQPSDCNADVYVGVMSMLKDKINLLKQKASTK